LAENGATPMTQSRTAPYGSWKSPLTAERAVSAGIALGDCSFDGELALWRESRPTEKGRNVVVQRARDGSTADLNAAPLNARTRVHEYGGRSYVMAEGVLFFSHFADQRLYRTDPGQAARAITPEGALRYADCAVDGRRGWLWCVREDHRSSGEPLNCIVVVDSQRDDAGGRIVASGQDFYAAPRLSPDGTQLAWLSWNHPDMPWDGSELWLATLRADGSLHDGRCIAGSRGEALQQPLWSPDGELYFISDRSGWWNLYRWRASVAQPLCPMHAEFGQPMWNFGLSTYAFESAQRLVCSYSRNALSQLACLDTASLQLRDIATPFSSIGSLAAAAGQVMFIGASATQAASVCLLDLDSGQTQVLRQGSTLPVDVDTTSVAQAIEFPTSDGLSAHGFFYPPKSRDFAGPPGDKPPLLVLSHGGPTNMALNAYKAGVQYWTSRGFAVLDVNYGGSSGFGRAYRQRLDGAWGVVDVDDCVNAAKFLVQRGDVDGRRLVIRGGSAGGFTTLCALAFRRVFSCGASHYGVGDLEALASDTHKFEARYLDRLVGPYPEARALYRARSPIHHVDKLSCPLILFQGSEDAVVPPEQSRRMHAAVKAKGVPVAYLEFEGEQHGFRDVKNIVRALEAEAYFYSRVFGFELADGVEPVLIDNL
jgi:dipeptidyl aminopeptidase/acylaminoacyl peptidase